MYFIHLMLLFSAYVGQPNVNYVSGSRQALKHKLLYKMKLNDYQILQLVITILPVAISNYVQLNPGPPIKESTIYHRGTCNHSVTSLYGTRVNNGNTLVARNCAHVVTAY